MEIDKKKIKLYVKNVLNKKLIYKIGLKENTRRLLYVVTVVKSLRLITVVEDQDAKNVIWKTD